MVAPPGPQILALTGATGVGKTAVALALADRLPVSLISLDSALVYQGMDIGTAKPDAATLARYPHALVDIRDPAQPYSAAEFLADADAAVRAAFAAGRLPVLVGGTMLYLKVFRDGLAAMPAADQAFRAQLRAEAAGCGWPALFERLQAADPVAARKIHPHNIPRLERALEVLALTGKPISAFWAGAGQHSATERHGARLIEIAIAPDDRSVLHDRLATRLDTMLAAGFVAEVQGLRARGDLQPELPALRAVGYRQVWDYLAGVTTDAQMRAAVLAATRQLAKRQLTWLRGFQLKSLLWGDPVVLAEQIARATRLEK